METVWSVWRDEDGPILFKTEEAAASFLKYEIGAHFFSKGRTKQTYHTERDKMDYLDVWYLEELEVR